MAAECHRGTRGQRPAASCAARRSGGASPWPMPIAHRLGRQPVTEAPQGPGETLENPSRDQLYYIVFCFHSGWRSIPVNRSYSGLCRHSLTRDYNYLSMHRYSKFSQVV